MGPEAITVVDREPLAEGERLKLILPGTLVDVVHRVVDVEFARGRDDLLALYDA